MGHHAPFSLRDFRKVVVRTDSQYVQDNVPVAISVWAKNQWTKKGGGAVLNVRDWKQLLTAMRRLKREFGLSVQFEWKKGKKGNHARAVDQLAKQSSDNPSFGRGRPNVVRRKTTSEKVDPGSVRMLGQILEIRIIQAQYLPPPRRSSRYKFEVVDESSQYLGRVDWVESEHLLKPGHTYLVRLNADQENPRIDEVLGEIEEDLTPYIEALEKVGGAVTPRVVLEEVNRSQALGVSQAGVKRRLDRLAEEGSRVTRTRSLGPGRPYLYELKNGSNLIPPVSTPSPKRA